MPYNKDFRAVGWKKFITRLAWRKRLKYYRELSKTNKYFGASTILAILKAMIMVFSILLHVLVTMRNDEIQSNSLRNVTSLSNHKTTDIKDYSENESLTKIVFSLTVLKTWKIVRIQLVLYFPRIPLSV